MSIGLSANHMFKGGHDKDKRSARNARYDRD